MLKRVVGFSNHSEVLLHWLAPKLVKASERDSKYE